MSLLKHEYEITGNSPYNLMRKLLVSTGGMSIFSDNRVTVLGSYDNTKETRQEFKQSVRAAISGKHLISTAYFPEELGNLRWITTVDSADGVDILYRHAPVVATNYDSSGKLPLEHFQPQVYFVISINKVDGTKTISPLASPYAVSNHIFPHQSGLNPHSLFNGYCDGYYRSSKQQALKQDDLSVALSGFAMYITNGTNREDTYGCSYSYFTEEAMVKGVLPIDTEREAKLASYIMMDKELPFAMSRGQYGVSFSSPEVEEAYKEAVSARLEEDEQQQEEV